MKEQNLHRNAITLLPLAAGLWLGYLLLSLVIDLLFYPTPAFPPMYYGLNAMGGLAVLGLARWHGGRARLGRAFLPLAIGVLSVPPVVLAQLTPPGQPPPGPTSSPEAMLLRTMPLLLIALVLTAWQYGWQYIIQFSGGIALLALSIHLYFFRPGGAPLLPPLIVLLIQTITFLVVGYFISTLIHQLEQQQEALRQANVRLTHYAATLEDLTISRERNRMARELHDTLAHTLSALSVQLETVKAYWEVDPQAAQAMLDKSLTATRNGLQETRRALKSLRASPLDDLGLALAVRQMAVETAQRANLRLNLDVPEQIPALSPAVEQCIYRVAQEAVTNAAHHANASALTVQLICDENIVLRVHDNGHGFDPQNVDTSRHFGLSGMRERAALAGGTLTVNSQPGQGTEIQLVIEREKL
ncbi:MAG: sensor histidine kinase [Chloroflexi bacterium]|nr:MAG: sensor histidine kinase [Chloroflexota bacterium]